MIKLHGLGSVNIRISRRIIASCLSGILFVSPASATDPGEGCCADLEERIVELEQTTVRKNNRKIKLQLSGWISRNLLFWDDGDRSDLYAVDSSLETSRFRFKGEGIVQPGLKVGFLLEYGVKDTRPSDVDQNDDDGSESKVTRLRHSLLYLKSARFGTMSIGQSKSATDGIAEIELSGAKVISRSKNDWNDTFFLRDKRTPGAAGQLSAVWRDVMPGAGLTQSSAFGPNLDGFGRTDRIRFDTPAMAGFILSASWGEDDYWDAALRIARRFGDFKIAAGIGYGQTTDESMSRDAATLTQGLRVELLSGSAAILHSPSGLNLNVAAGRLDIDSPNKTANVRTVSRTDKYYYVKGGVSRKFFSSGKTSVYAEYYRGQIDMNNGASLNASLATTFGGATSVVDKSDASWWGVGVVQKFDRAALEIYAAHRHYSADVTVDNGAVAASLEEFDAFMTGARLKF